MVDDALPCGICYLFTGKSRLIALLRDAVEDGRKGEVCASLLPLRYLVKGVARATDGSLPPCWRKGIATVEMYAVKPIFQSEVMVVVQYESGVKSPWYCLYQPSHLLGCAVGFADMHETNATLLKKSDNLLCLALEEKRLRYDNR